MPVVVQPGRRPLSPHLLRKREEEERDCCGCCSDFLLRIPREARISIPLFLSLSLLRPDSAAACKTFSLLSLAVGWTSVYAHSPLVSRVPGKTFSPFPHFPALSPLSRDVRDKEQSETRERTKFMHQEEEGEGETGGAGRGKEEAARRFSFPLFHDRYIPFSRLRHVVVRGCCTSRVRSA